VLLTVLLNFALDPLFIFGWGPIPAYGVAGAAWATLCTQALAMFIGLVLLARGDHGIRLHARDFRPDFAFMRRVFRIGAPASIEQSTQALGMNVMMLLVAGFGTITVAAYGIGIRVASSVIIPAMGLSMATSTLVGQNIGAGQLDRAEQTNRIGCAIAFGTMMLSGVILFFAARPLCYFFAPEGGRAIDESAEFIRIIAFTFSLVGVQQVLTGTLRGAGDTVSPMLLAIVGLWVFRFPLAYVLSQHTSLGSTGIWWSFSVSNVLTTVATWFWFARGAWKGKRLIDEVQLEQRVRNETVIEEGLPF
jgi:putative MATE family efflux protein